MGKKFKKRIQIFSNFFCYPFSLFWAYLGITFVSGLFLSSKKNSKDQNKSFTCNYLPEISFVSRKNNSPLGVKYFKWNFSLAYIFNILSKVTSCTLYTIFYTMLQSWNLIICKQLEIYFLKCKRQDLEIS